MTITAERLEKLGMKKAAGNLETKKKLGKKLTLAYEHFRFVTPEKIGAFNEKLKAESIKLTGKKGKDLVEHYDKLCFSTLSSYEDIPPVEVLEKVEAATEVGCFDSFEVAQVKNVHVYKDPIIFGRIEGCGDRFFIAQWDNDVRIEDILKENEG